MGAVRRNPLKMGGLFPSEGQNVLECDDEVKNNNDSKTKFNVLRALRAHNFQVATGA